MTLTSNIEPITFGLLFAATIISVFLSGSTVQWTLNKGLMEKKLLAKSNQYNVLCFIAALSAAVHTVLCFFNNLTVGANVFGVMLAITANWAVMVNSSIMLVSQRLALTFQQPTLAWKRLLWINYIAIPCCVIIGTSWAVSWSVQTPTPVLDRFVKIIEPIQIALFGVIEFVLSGAFIVQMWKYRWTDVEKHSMFMLFLIGALDLISVCLNLFLGDLESTCVKGLVYSLRIRLEVNVLCCMVDYIKNRRGVVTYGSSTRGDSKRRSASQFFGLNKEKRGSVTSQNGSKKEGGSKKLTRFDSEIQRLRDELDSSHTNNGGTPSPFGAHVPTRINPDSTFTVSQLRSSIDSRPPTPLSEEFVNDDDFMEEGEIFSNDYIKEHVLASRREERNSKNAPDKSTVMKKPPLEAALGNDTSSTWPIEQSASSHTFHNDIDGDIESPHPFDSSTHSSVPFQGPPDYRYSQEYSPTNYNPTMVMDDSTASVMDASHSVGPQSHVSALTGLQDREESDDSRSGLEDDDCASEDELQEAAPRAPRSSLPYGYTNSYSQYLRPSSQTSQTPPVLLNNSVSRSPDADYHSLPTSISPELPKPSNHYDYDDSPYGGVGIRIPPNMPGGKGIFIVDDVNSDSEFYECHDDDEYGSPYNSLSKLPALEFS